MDETLLFPLSTACQLLVLFASLDSSQLIETIKVRVLSPLRAALKHADKLKTADVIIRLQVLLFVIDHGVLLSNEWFDVLCNLLSKRADDKEDETLMYATRAIAFFVGQMKDKKKQKENLLKLQTN